MGIEVPFLVRDREIGRQIPRERVVEGADRFDEVWDGTYVVMVQPNNEHQDLVTDLAAIYAFLIRFPRRERVLAGTNVSDRLKGWKENYRCPDIAVVLDNGKAKDCGTYWLGGPDFLTEVVSDDDATREKIPFYSALGVRELLIVDRDPWKLELLRHDGTALVSVGIAGVENQVELESEVLGLIFRLVGAGDRPQIEVRTKDGSQSWLV